MAANGEHDIVYILRNDIGDATDELRYSLRSVEKNLPYRKIWFYGGVPEGLTPDKQVELQQQGLNKWQKVCYTLKAVCNNADITPDFYLFNDDFFIMQKVEGDIPPMVKVGTVRQWAEKIRNETGRISAYQHMLLATSARLLNFGFKDLNYALHTPMLINRKKALEALNLFGGVPMFRTFYGNYCNLGGKVRNDVKISDLETVPDPNIDFLSTNGDSFKNGAVGEYIRKKFNRKIWREGKQPEQ